jgi:hypothetical protein
MKWIKANKLLSLIILSIVLVVVIVIDITIRLMFGFHLTFYFSPYIGVIIGASLGWIGSFVNNWINNSSEKRKRKSQIKYDLLSTYHLYYQYTKSQIINSNKKAFLGRRYDIYIHYKLDADILTVNKEMFRDVSNQFDQVFLLLQKVESDIVAIQHEINDLLKDQIDCDKFNELINKVISDGNTAIDDFSIDLTSVNTVEAINKIGESINKINYEKEVMLFQKGELIKKEISGIFE